MNRGKYYNNEYYHIENNIVRISGGTYAVKYDMSYLERLLCDSFRERSIEISPLIIDESGHIYRYLDIVNKLEHNTSKKLMYIKSILGLQRGHMVMKNGTINLSGILLMINKVQYEEVILVSNNHSLNSYWEEDNADIILKTVGRAYTIERSQKYDVESKIPFLQNELLIVNPNEFPYEFSEQEHPKNNKSIHTKADVVIRELLKILGV